MISESLQILHDNFKNSAIRYRKAQAELIDYALDGKNTVENLITLCVAHHSLIHAERN
jgi:hypothetical protein